MPSLALIQSPQLQASNVSILFRDLPDDVAVSVPIGRTVGVGMRIPNDPKVSKRHCIVYQEVGQLRVLPLNTTHGTFLQRGTNAPAQLQPGEEYALQVGDVLQVGDSLIEVRDNTFGTKADESELRRGLGVRDVNSFPTPRGQKDPTR